MTHPRMILCSYPLFVLAAACGGNAGYGDQTPDASTPAPKTFAAQVALGAQAYGEYCAKCHGASGQGTDTGPRLVGLDQGALPLDPPADRKVRTEKFVTVADVANFAVANMPADKPGSLSTEEYLAVLAFDLKANGITLDQPLTLDLAETLTIPR
jgi:mono/diheme cytochrome c family protein